MAAVLVEHVWATALEDAVARTGGTPVASEFVDATALTEHLAEDAAGADRLDGAAPASPGRLPTRPGPAAGP